MKVLNTLSTPEVSFSDLWVDIEVDEHAELLRNKREDVTIELNSLLHQQKISRAELAKKLDWKPSRVSKALSGNENLTLNSLTEIVNAAGLDFDLVFRAKGSQRTLQPWEHATATENILHLQQELACVVQHTKTQLEAAQAINRMMFRRAHSMKKQRDDEKTLSFVIWHEEKYEAIAD